MSYHNPASTINQTFLTRKFYRSVMIGIFLSVAILYTLSFFVPFNSQLQTRKDASGFEHHYASKFFYFYYYTGFFPLATLDTQLNYSSLGAKNEIAMHGKDLIMEYKHWSRLGEHARIGCYMPDAVVKGTAQNPSLKLFNTLFFLLGLCLLFHGFYVSKHPLIGLILCSLILITPYFHYEVFRNENIFALQASVFFIVMGLLLPTLLNPATNLGKSILMVVIASLVLAFCSEIRNEISIVFACLLMMILWSSSLGGISKSMLLLLAILFFAGGKKLIQRHFDVKYEKTKQLVASKAGHVYNGQKIAGHKLWHPIFCGLGDYDQQFGYAWNDTVAYAYAVPILNERYQMHLNYSGKLYTDNYYDSAHLYYIKFDEIPQYESVVKEKVLNDIQHHPMWYLKILGQRFLKICSTTLPIPFMGFVAMLGFIFFIYQKKSSYVKLILVSLPLSATSLLIYSGKGATYNAMFGYLILAFLLYEFIQFYTKKRSCNQ